MILKKNKRNSIAKLEKENMKNLSFRDNYQKMKMTSTNRSTIKKK